MNEFIAILTTHQKDSLIGELVCEDVFFNPSLDVAENWFISSEEIQTSIYPQHEWVKDLVLVPYTGPYVPPSPTPLPSGTTLNF